jgi:predicted DNA-binding protein (UPF0251 family)
MFGGIENLRIFDLSKQNDQRMEKQRKSASLSAEQLKAFKAKVKKAKTVVACAEEMGISRQVVDRILLKGQGSPASIEKVINFLNHTN